MGSFSWVHWVVLLTINLVLIGVPVAQILKRLGINRLWAFLAILPLVNMLGLWLLAFVRWPRDGSKEP